MTDENGQGASTNNNFVQTQLKILIFNNTGIKYKRWLQRFEGTCAFLKIKEGDKLSYLLQNISSAVYDNLCDHLGGDNPYTKSYDLVSLKLQELYEPQTLEIAENFRFNQRKQQPGEDTQTFSNALNHLAETCNFGAFKDTALRNQFVFGLSNNRIQARLLETKDLTYSKALQTAHAMELSEKETTSLQGSSSSVNFIQAGIRQYGGKKKFNNNKFAKRPRGNEADNNSRENRNNDTSCFRCGKKGHTAQKCRLQDKLNCSYCKAKGHVAQVCFKKNREVKMLEYASTSSTSDDEPIEILILEEEENYHREKFLSIGARMAV